MIKNVHSAKTFLLTDPTQKTILSPVLPPFLILYLYYSYTLFILLYIV